MNYLTIKVLTQTASFRIPEFQNFHKSFVLPPPTTIIGFAGAALGLSAKQAQEFFEKNAIDMGVYGRSQGVAKDLWKYNDFKAGSVIKREIFFLNEFIIAFGANKTWIIEQLRNAFENPVYALTFGTSDSLAKISFINSYKETKSDELEHCLIKGDIISEVMENIQNGLEFSIYSTSDPIVYDLPIAFHYESDFGVRKVIDREQFSFIGRKMKLNVKKHGIAVDGKFIPVLQLRQKNA